ncbi:MAG TPA: ABC transporter ATP-binding protein [bacterium]|nr:ABC transporter ATP-binding protein [bacterium]
MLELHDITAGYGPITVLRGITLRVDEGGAVCVLGPNGAGKTTLLRTIVGLLPAAGGEVRFLGRRVTGLRPSEIVRRGISLVPERRELFPHLSVRENLALGAYVRGRDPSVADDLERVFGLFPRLRERLRQQAATLSGGEQQMLAIGRALMARPRLLLLDEPSLGLSPLLVQEMFRAVGTIRAQGTAVLLVEQNAHMALTVADRGYVLESGRVVLEDASENLRTLTILRDAYLGQV